MAETTSVSENSSSILSNNKNHDSIANSLDNSQLKAESTFISSETNESSNTPINSTLEDTQHSQPNSDKNNTRAKSSMNEMRPTNRFPLHPGYPHHYQTAPPLNYNQNMNQSETQAQLVAFTPPLMSVRLPQQQSQTHRLNSYPARSYMQNHTLAQSNEQSSFPPKSKSEPAASQPEYYVDSFASNFSNKPSSNNKTKTKHVTFQEPEAITESKTNSDDIIFPESSSPSSSGSYYSTPAYMYPSPRPFYRADYDYYQPHHGFHPAYQSMMMNQPFMIRPREVNMMPMSSLSTPPTYYSDQQQPAYPQHLFQPKQLYDPKKPKIPSTRESSDSSNVIRNITPKNKKKTKKTNNNDNPTVSTAEPVPRPITILRKPSPDTKVTSPPPPVADRPVTLPEEESSITPSADECPDILSEKDQKILPSVDNRSVSDIKSIPMTNTNLSLPSHELLSILQSANCISSLNEYVQKTKLTMNYYFSSISPSSFTCIVSIDNRQFPASSPCSSKNEAQKLACDQALRTLYRESCANEQSSLEFSTKHDYIAHRSVSTFQDLNVNELLLGRKTLACMLMITNKQFEQARVISIGTGNGCLDEINLTYADDGTALHDCHAEILARRGLIRFLFEQIKQSKNNNNNNNQSSIFEYNSIINKYQLRDHITFHMYISSLPCGNAALKISSNSIRYKQGQTEGTLLASTSSIKYPIKSCSDKIYRWNILGIQGGLLINLIDKPIYLETITLACETTFDRNHVKYSLGERLNEHFQSLPTPFLLNAPDINCPTIKSLQQERQVAKLQTSAFAWNITQPVKTELLEPMTGRLKTNRSMSTLSKQNLFEDFTNFIQANFPDDKSLSFTTYQQAKQLNQTYIKVKNLIATAFQTGSSDTNISWLSKSDQLEQFSIQ